MVRRRRAIIIASSALVALVVVLVLLFASFYGPQPPEVRLLTLEPSKGYDPAINRIQYEALFAALPTLTGEEILIAQFEILFPKESGSTMSGQIGYEILGSNGELIDKGSWSGPSRFSPLAAILPRTFALRPKFVLPHQARTVRLTIGCQPPTLRERSQMLFQKWGLRARYPKASASVSRLLPHSYRPFEHRAMIELPAVPPVDKPRSK